MINQRTKKLSQHSVCLGVNVQGMNPSLHSKSFWKLHMLREEIYKLNRNNLCVPFLAVTETWLKPHIFDEQISIENYSVYRADRKNPKMVEPYFTYIMT